MTARKRVPAENKSTEHLTVNLTPVEMEALKQFAADEKRSVNSLVKMILTKEIRRRTERSKPFVISCSWPNQPHEGFRHQRATTLDEVRRITSDLIANAAGIKRITVRRGAGYGGEEVDTWYPDRGWIDGRVEPKENK